jgi:Skp family chaperone for outer membrane proteins
MNRNLTLLTALGAGLALAPLVAAAQPGPAQAPAAAAPAAPASNAAAPSRIALINFQQVVLASNEGQTVTLATQKKYEPKKTEIETLSKEVDAKNKALQAAPTTLPDAERASRLQEIDRLTKKLNAEAEEAGQEYNAEWQEALGKVAQKIAAVVNTYADINGYTIVLDVSGQQNNVFWAKDNHQDISQAVVDAYNKQSGVPAPAPAAPTPQKPATTTPRPAVKPATPPPAKP